MERSETHLIKIKQHLLAGNELTKLDALKIFGCWNTGDIIFKLRNQGLPIQTEMIKEGKKTYAVYKLKKNKQLVLFDE